ncbi:MAG: hypothetical protein HY298_26790 [Verrucomicrobia bacterium]|nr:hypothetical protein [Verrucomicrobiota bacterium]
MKIEQEVCSKAYGRLGGFSLVETVVGMGIMGVAALALLSGFTGGFFTMQMARENQRATQIILEKTETIRLYNWDQVNSNGFIPSTFTATYDPQGTNSSVGTIYNGTLIITNVGINASYSNDMKRVIVTLNWQTGNVNRSRTYTTFIGRNGIQNYIY